MVTIYYRFLIEHSDDAKHKFERLAKNVWDVNPLTGSATENAIKGLETMEAKAV